jgi:pullulanase
MQHLIQLAQAGLTHICICCPRLILPPLRKIAAWVRNRTRPNSPPFPPTPTNNKRHPRNPRPGRLQLGLRPLPLQHVPEGSYATDPNGSARILEFRQMVQSLNENGLRVVADVVYNHTNASGQSERSVLDRLCPVITIG